MAETYPNLERDMPIQVPEAQRSPNRINPKNVTQKHIIIKLSTVKDKEKILKAAREKRIYDIQRNPYKAISGFLSRKLTSQETVG